MTSHDAMTIMTQPVANWGNYPAIEAEIAAPENVAEARDYLLSHERLIARGNGKCYGDAALSPHLLSTLHLNRILNFNPETGIVECEAGVLLSDLLEIIVPAGWFFHVTPGIKHITVGGAIASDVHGKNHPAKGCFSNWLLSFDLMTAKGQILTCSRTENIDLFWQTCGGMGWTGVILSAKFYLMEILSAQMRQKTVRAKNLDALFHAFEENSDWQYSVGWVDGTSAEGRGAAFFAEHCVPPPVSTPPPAPPPKGRGDAAYATNRSKSPLPFGGGAGGGVEKKRKINIPLFAPSWLLNPLTIRIYNELFFRKNAPGERHIDLDACFYPLDKIQNWNRLYGRRGFIQYQFCLPEENSFDGIRQVLEAVRRSPETPFLTVLKRHGERPPEAVHSFPVRGYSLALDFPRTKTVFHLVEKLDDLVWSFGGKIYLAKDACSAPRMGRVNPAAFGDEKFFSMMKGRIQGTKTNLPT